MRVLVIDDDPNIAEVISVSLEIRWPQIMVLTAADGDEGLSLVESESPDVVILDIGLPGMSGFEVCREIRRFSDVPIIMLTVRDMDTDVAHGLQMGADDYLTKPFSHIELISRIQAVLRRVQGLPISKGEGVFSSGNLQIDFDGWEVQVGGEVVKLTPKEYSLLYHLSRNAGRVLTYYTMLSKIWGEEYKEESSLLKLHIHNLRRKLGDDTQKPKIIVNERGVGYKFVRVD